MKERIRSCRSALCCLLAALVMACVIPMPAFAAEKPTIAAEGAALYNATTGEFLFEKNGSKQFYPASITKIMTALLTLENCSQDEIVTFTDSATKNLESGAVSLDVTTGDQISVKDCLYGLLLKSANEVANGLAEHISGSVPAFADKMNIRAKELGCTNTNFVNPNGLNNSKHLTTPKDMCLIAAACFARDDFKEIDRTTSYHFPATINRPNGTDLTMGHKMISSASSKYYPGILGGKTGYTRLAGNTLVTCVEKNGVRLVAVVMKSLGTHYTDTKALLDYGFAIAGDSGSTVTAADAAAAAAAAAAAVQNAAQDPDVQNAAAALIGPGAALELKNAAESAAAAVQSAAADVSAAQTTAAPETTASVGTVQADPNTESRGPEGYLVNPEDIKVE